MASFCFGYCLKSGPKAIAFVNQVLHVHIAARIENGSVQRVSTAVYTLASIFFNSDPAITVNRIPVGR